MSVQLLQHWKKKLNQLKEMKCCLYFILIQYDCDFPGSNLMQSKARIVSTNTLPYQYKAICLFASHLKTTNCVLPSTNIFNINIIYWCIIFLLSSFQNKTCYLTQRSHFKLTVFVKYLSTFLVQTSEWADILRVCMCVFCTFVKWYISCAYIIKVWPWHGTKRMFKR